MRAVSLAVGAALLVVAPAVAQFPARERDRAPNFKQFNVPYDGRVTFVRFRFTPLRTGYGRGGGFFGGVNYWWDHDYPRAERNFTTMVAELTAAPVQTEGSNILGADDPELFQYPIAYVSEPGWWTMTAAEAATLRAYLLKGGFLIIDDFGGDDWFNFEQVMRQVLPDARFVELDVSHPIFNAFYTILSLEERGTTGWRRPVYLGVFENNDPAKRLMMIVNYNNDIGDAWEWSDTGFIPVPLTNEAYKLGINYLVYALTH